MNNFQLNETLDKDSIFVTDLPLSQVRLLKNASWPWVMLVPRRNNMKEIIDLSIAEQHQLMEEISCVSFVIKTLFSPDKLNVANLGNVVSQLHIHIVARYKNDAAWPNPIWGRGISSDYNEQMVKQRVEDIRRALEQ